jgi:hypothetical protein
MRALRIAVAVLVLLLGTVTASVLASGASAATTGAGIRGITPYGGYLGNYLAPDGTRVYCIDAARDWPSGPTGAGVLTSSVTTEWGDPLPADVLRKFDYALRRYGQTADPVQAAALNAYLYSYTSGYARTHGASVEAGRHYINGHAAVLDAYSAIWADAESLGGVTPVAEVTIDLSAALSGTVTVTSSLVDATGTLELEGAVVDDTGASTAVVRPGETVPISGRPEVGAHEYSVSAEVTFTAAATAVGAVTLYTTGSQQRTIRDAGAQPIDVSARDAVGPIALPFAPVLTSLVEAPAIDSGSPARDTLTVAVTDGRPWPEVAGAPVPVIATGTLYGPFPHAPSEQEAPPADAPVAGTESVTLTGAGEVVTAGAVRPTAPGWYTWVWRIDATAQSPAAQAVLPPGYAFSDRFGLSSETLEVLPARLAETGATIAPLPVAAALLVIGVLLGNIRGRRAFRSV